MAIPTFRDLVAMLGKTLTIEAQQTIMALQEEHLNLREQNNQLREENAKLKQLAEVKKKLQYEAPYYMLLDGGSKDGPFCQNCYDTHERLVRLQRMQGPGVWKCQSCDKLVATEATVGLQVRSQTGDQVGPADQSTRHMPE